MIHNVCQDSCQQSVGRPLLLIPVMSEGSVWSRPAPLTPEPVVGPLGEGGCKEKRSLNDQM